MLEFLVPPEKIATLLQDPYLAKKYNRETRLQEKQDYIERFVPEIAGGGLFVVDIGPGPGEFLELARHYGNRIMGVDSPSENAMGAEYETLSRLCHEYQKIPVTYYGLDGFVEDPFGGYDVINLQGSLEMAMERCLIGKDFHKHHRVQDMVLDLTLGRSYLQKVFDAFYAKLNPGGRVILYCNNVKNHTEYTELIDHCSGRFTGGLVNRKGTLWLFRKS